MTLSANFTDLFALAHQPRPELDPARELMRRGELETMTEQICRTPAFLENSLFSPLDMSTIKGQLLAAQSLSRQSEDMLQNHGYTRHGANNALQDALLAYLEAETERLHMIRTIGFAFEGMRL